MTLKVTIRHDTPFYDRPAIVRVFDPCTRQVSANHVLQAGESIEVTLYDLQSLQVSEGAPLPPVVNAGPPQTDPPIAD